MCLRSAMMLLLLQACNEAEMKIVKPIEVSDSNYTSTIPEPDASVGEVEWLDRDLSLYSSVDMSALSVTDSGYRYIDGSNASLMHDANRDMQSSYTVALAGDSSGLGYDGEDTIVVVDVGGSAYFYKYDRLGNYVDDNAVSLLDGQTIEGVTWSRWGVAVIYVTGANSAQIRVYSFEGDYRPEYTTEIPREDPSGSFPTHNRDLAFDSDVFYVARYDSDAGSAKIEAREPVTGNLLNKETYGELVSAQGISADDGVITLSSTVAGVGNYSFAKIGTSNLSVGQWFVGEECILTSIHKRYSCIITTNERPDTGVSSSPATWVEIGGTNKYASFDTNIGNPSIAHESNPSIAPVITSTITVAANEFVTGIVGISVKDASTVLIEVDNGSLIYSNTIDMAGEDRFAALDLPNTDDVTITITVEGFVGGESVSIGELILGPQDEIGVSQYSSSYQLLDFSRVDRDDFGNISVTKRGYADLMTFNVKIDASDFSYVRQTMEGLRGTPSVWLGNDDDASKAVYGIYKDLNINWSSPSLYDCSFKIEGMT